MSSCCKQLAALTVLLTACGDGEPSGPSGEPGVYIAGVVRDAEGSPVPDMMLLWEAWPVPDSVQAGNLNASSVSWFGRADSTGDFSFHVGYYSVPLLDSIEISIAADPCWGLGPDTLRERDVILNPDEPETVIRRDLILPRIAPRARLAVGPACAVMVTAGAPGYDSEDLFQLWIDEISDSVYGRWRISYQGSRGDDLGLFSGWREGSALTLQLRNDSTYEAPPLGTCTGFTVDLPLEVGDTLGAGTYRSEGCPVQPALLQFMAVESVSWASP